MKICIWQWLFLVHSQFQLLEAGGWCCIIKICLSAGQCHGKVLIGA